MAVVSDNPRCNTKRGNEGQCPAKESALLLLRLVFTHGEDLLQDFLDIFIHLALGHAQKTCIRILLTSRHILPRGNEMAETKPFVYSSQMSGRMSVLPILSFPRYVKDGSPFFPLGDG